MLFFLAVYTTEPDKKKCRSLNSLWIFCTRCNFISSYICIHPHEYLVKCLCARCKIITCLQTTIKKKYFIYPKRNINVVTHIIQGNELFPAQMYQGCLMGGPLNHFILFQVLSYAADGQNMYFSKRFSPIFFKSS